ncbi:iron chelate uptake ABC transporter family permease subunit [Kitasatospora sp. NPDC088779]|uniref:iron chelate uptake ABC transporter family permease subunit n=1 Tax=Kitasatospora sp. NPDC088779 TaxID=3154964 RepID=UPI003428A2C8
MIDVVVRRLGLGGPHVTLLDDQIVWQLRLPRVLGAAATGAGLAVCGAVLQTLTGNDLADPFLLGISDGAAAGAVTVIVLGVGVTGAVGTGAVATAAFVGALLDLARHVHGDTAEGAARAEEWLLTTYPRSAVHAQLRDLRTAAVRLSDPADDRAALRACPAAASCWQAGSAGPGRAGALARYGEALRAATPRGSELPGLVHLHHNRLLGIDPEAEDHARSVARGATEAQRGRRLRRPWVQGRTG